MPDTIPPWLATMRAITGTEEYAGGADNPIIIGWRNEIAHKFPEMADYCRNYTHDEIPWCGLTVAYVMAHNGIRPVFGSADTDKFLWAQAWKQFGTNATAAQPGDMLVFPRHVTLFERQEGDRFIGRGGNQSDSVKESSYPIHECEAIRRPPARAIVGVPKPPRRFENIWATVFSDDSVAYPDVAPGWSERSGVALPAWFAGKRPQVRVFNAANGLSVVCEIIDQGPWNYTSKMSGLPGDPYWLTGMRPQAESGIDMIGRPTNFAGIDLTPAAARAIGFDVVERDGKIAAGGGLVHWEFVGDDRPIFIPPPDTSGKPMPPETPTPFNAALEDCMRELIEAQRPIVGRYLKSSQALTSVSAIDDLITRLGGTPPVRTGQVLLPPPAPPRPEPPPPVPPPPAAPAQSPLVINMMGGLAGVLTGLGLGAADVISTPFGPSAGLVGQLWPIVSMGAAALGIPAPILSLVQGLFSRLQSPVKPKP